MSPDVIAAMLSDFNQKIKLAQKSIGLLSDQYPNWQPEN